MLLQRDNSEVERAILFFSEKLSPAPRNYFMFERKCLAIICVLEHIFVYLLGRKFRLRTDHRALVWLLSKKPKASARISGWLARLMKYPIVIEYVRGSENNIADALSRLDSVVVDYEVPADLAKDVPSFACPATQVNCLAARTDWLAAHRADGTILFVADLLRRRARLEPTDIELNPQLKPFADVWPQLVLENELVNTVMNDPSRRESLCQRRFEKKCFVHCTRLRITATRRLFIKFCSVSGGRSYGMTYLLS